MIRKKKISEVPIGRLMPNFITILSLCLGITSVRYAMDEKWVWAVTLILTAGFMDGLDGRLARLLNASSNFGAQLDSLADIVNFGVAPALVIYMWSLQHIPVKGVGWSLVLFYLCCSALRLARFNSALDDPHEKARSLKYFTGMPMPSAACSLLLPLVLTFEVLEGVEISYYFMVPYMAIVGLLMVSRIPLFSFKNIRIPTKYVLFFLVGTAALIAATILQPWVILPIIGLLYLLTIPFSSYLSWQEFSKK